MICGSAISIAERMRQTGGRPSGFDYVRLFLAIAVFLIHVPLVTSGWSRANELWLSWARPGFVSVLPMFFALSGFLVAGSLARCNTLISFFGLRVFRIVPPLAVEVLLSAVILGPIFTANPLSEYFVSSTFFSYFLNVVGDVHYYLPGVFSSNPFPNVVNAQLWALPLELCCYVLLGMIALLGIFGNTVIITSTMVVICIASFAYDFVHSIDRVVIFRIVVVEAFFVGVAFFRLRERIPVNMGLFLVSLAVTGVLVFIPHGAFFVALPLVYVTIYLGLSDPGRNRILLSGDYSYGIYLYGVPIQQAVVAALPALKFGIMQFLVAFPITLVLAILSWWLIEKPVLKLRRWLPVLETHIQIGLNKFISERRRLSATQTKQL